MLDDDETSASEAVSSAESGLNDLVAAYLQSRSKDPPPSLETLQRWLADEETAVDWNGTYSSSAASELRRWTQWMHDRDSDLEELREPNQGPQVMRRYAQRLRRRTRGDNGISAATARTYYAYIRACLSWGVRDGRLDRNPALPDEATEELPESSSNRSDQQHWTPEQRQQLLDYTRQRAHDVIDEEGHSPGAIQAARDRALVAMLYFAAVRGAEVLRHRRDSREGRQGLCWNRVSLTDGTVELLGKGEQAWVKHPLPGPTTEYLKQLKRVQRPASDSWPVFATSHAPSKWSAAREGLPEQDVDELAKDLGSIEAVLREYDVSPPSLTTDGARSRLQTLTENAGVDLDEDADYLQPHGARRGMIGEVFKRDRGEAQDLGRHKDMSTTEASYRHLEVEEQRKRLDGLIEDIDGT